ncbi:hypothetical protein ACFWZ2_10700 [Streptomyces sp. NPDC059002]|uniref:hypothetical protein n=1 Tax=Streptomyces sp. NPDC059002 TaxID=3346690 RepID=UPI0036784B02
MTQPPQPSDGNPYGQQQPYAPQQPYGQQPPQQQQPYAAFPQQQPLHQGGFPAPQPPARTGNVGLGMALAVVLLFVTAGIYGAILKAVEHEIGYAAIGVGLIIGFAAGKVGGRHTAIPIVAAVAALIAVYLGQLTGYAMAIGEGFDVSFLTVFTDHFDLVNEVWKHEKDVLTFVFLAVGGAAAFSAAKKAGDQ